MLRQNTYLSGGEDLPQAWVLLEPSVPMLCFLSLYCLQKLGILSCQLQRCFLFNVHRAHIVDKVVHLYPLVVPLPTPWARSALWTWRLLGILNIITKSRLSFLILVTVPKMPNLSLIPLKPSCHPQYDMRDVVLKYAIALLNK